LGASMTAFILGAFFLRAISRVEFRRGIAKRTQTSTKHDLDVHCATKTLTHCHACILPGL